MNLYNAKAIKRWDQYTMEQEPISSIELMERAARQCTKWIVANAVLSSIKIFCGKGNNGGDGLAIARQLAQQHIGVQVYVLELGKPGSADFQENLHRLHAMDVAIHFIQDDQSFPDISSTDILIDCLFGSGLSRPLDGLAASLVKHLNQSQAIIIAVDVPSGMFLDKSSKGQPMVEARHTLTFQALKRCFLVAENEAFFGSAIVLDIGLHSGYHSLEPAKYQMLTHQNMQPVYKPRKSFSHKGTFGHALIVAGSKGKMGACLLSSKACLVSGAGLVTAAVPTWGMKILQTAFAEAMALDTGDLADIDWNFYQALGIGPGLGTQKEASKVLELCLHSFKKPMVVDADGLNLISKNSGWLSKLPANSILTPHPKEFERLFGPTKNDFDKLDLAIKNAAEYGIYIVLKGHHTFIACPTGNGFFNSTGNAGMATAGTGDVLAGIITGLLAQGYHSEHAACLGVYLHGLAGDLAADACSAEASIASDLVNHLGKAYKSLTQKE